MSKWLEEGVYGTDEVPKKPVEEEPADDREYGFAVPFERAFSLFTVVKLAERMVKANPVVIVGCGLVIIVATMMRCGIEMPLPRFYDRIIIGTVWGVAIHQLVFTVHLGMVFGSYVISNFCKEVAYWCRGEGPPDPMELVLNWKTGLNGVLYEFMAAALTWAVAAPFLLMGMLAGYVENEPAALLMSALSVIVAMLAWMATRPGLWAAAIDDLPARYALLQSIIVPLRHPITVGAVFLVGGAAFVVGIGLLVIPSFFVAGAFHAGVAGAWVLFGATPDEIDGSELLKKSVKVNRPKPL